MAVVVRLHSDLLSTNRLIEASQFHSRSEKLFFFGCHRRRVLLRPAAALKIAEEKKPAICTADELHYVDVENSNWRLALWRYLPSPQAPQRNHPLLLLSGVGMNAIGYDLSPEHSFARYMASQGYDTWTLELRGAGLSTPKIDFGEASGRPNLNGTHKNTEFGFGQLQPINLFDYFVQPSQGDRSDLAGGNNFSVLTQMRDFSRNLSDLIEWVEGSPPPLFPGMQERISLRLKDLQEQLEILVKYDWDFENHLEDDVPVAMEYIKAQCKPKDGKLLAVGHSMGGILLYATLSRCCSEGTDSGLASIATLGSSLDYTTSRSSLRMLLPLVDPTQAFDVPAIPMGVILSAVHHFATRPPYALAWLSTQISAPDMMPPELLEKLSLESFCTVPFNVLAQLSTLFQEQGMSNRDGAFFYKDHLGKSKVPILAIAGDQDLICPPEAVHETVKLIPKNLITCTVFGQPGGPHYGHYDIVGARLAKDTVYPCVVEFLNRHDAT